MPRRIKKCDKVRYFQPDVDGILAFWSGKPKSAASGEIREATVTRVDVAADGHRYYQTKEGVVLDDADLR